MIFVLALGKIYGIGDNSFWIYISCLISIFPKSSHEIGVIKASICLASQTVAGRCFPMHGHVSFKLNEFAGIFSVMFYQLLI